MVAALVVCWLAATAGAQPAFYTPVSLEARVARAEAVVLGSISSATPTVVVPPGGYISNSTRMPDGTVRTSGYTDTNGRMRWVINFKVDEVIKGPRRKSVELLALGIPGVDQRYEQWAGAHTPFLCFIPAPQDIGVQSEPQYLVRGLGWGDAIRLGPPVPGERTVSGTERGPPVLGMDFARLATREEILARARGFARRQKGPCEEHKLFLPPGVGRDLPAWPTPLGLVVPVVPSLERLAHRMIDAPDAFSLPSLQGSRAANSIAAYERAGTRAGGVAALKWFRSASNVKLLKKLLDDPMSRTVGRHQPGEPVVYVREYPVRASAYAVLAEWGITVPAPVSEESVPAPGPGK